MRIGERGFEPSEKFRAVGVGDCRKKPLLVLEKIVQGRLCDSRRRVFVKFTQRTKTARRLVKFAQRSKTPSGCSQKFSQRSKTPPCITSILSPLVEHQNIVLLVGGDVDKALVFTEHIGDARSYLEKYDSDIRRTGSIPT